MSQENLEGVADVLAEMVEMRESDPQGYEAMLQDLRSGDEDEIARQRGEALLDQIDQIQAGRGQGHNELLELLNRAHRQEAEGKQE